MSSETFSWVVIALLVCNAGLLVWIWRVVRHARDHRESLEPVVREEFRVGREEADRTIRGLREEIARTQHASTEQLGAVLHQIGKSQGERLTEVTRQLENLARSNESRLDRLRESVEQRLDRLQKNNELKLDQMRKTVDEQLQGTLEKRLGESFRLVSERLEQVHKGLGEMQQLAPGVGDLNRVLTNVKTKGTWGEVQLGALLEQILTRHQYEANVKPKPGSNEIVEFAIRLPGPDDAPAGVVWLPIDAKFPQDYYHRLLDAADSGDSKAVQQASAALARAVGSAAADIQKKYLAPPHTTDFGILFLPTEGLYAEVVRDPELLDRLQQRHRVVVAGPTTLSAILNSLQMGFRTLAIERRSSEVWTVLSAVKTEFGKFGEVLDRVKKQLDTASRSIDQTGTRSRAIERKLRSVEELPSDGDAAGLLGLSAEDHEDPEESRT
ncbi:MAG: DNA recombination protein RmuC [Gammaproteobacteria bacterium]|nr:DNA recombination protein RmuC [Gammaproteobacteria bacterium]